jgi:adenine-specific DNA-methyltransferase
MKLRDNQTFMSLYFESNAVEFATGEENSFLSAENWERDTKHFGQVATPEPIADLMAKWVMSAKPAAVLDPATGLGGLLAACRKFQKQTILIGVERDIETLQRAKTSAPSGTKLILADYLKSDTGQFDGIIANPPYIKSQRLDYSEKDWCYFEERLGTPLDRLTNIYALFLLKIWEDLAPHGRAAIILPAEFLNANFGEEIKERLVRAIRPVAISVFAPSLNIFEDVLTTSAIVFLEKGRSPKLPCWVKRLNSIEEASHFVNGLLSEVVTRAGDSCIDLKKLRPCTKWLNLLFNGERPAGSEALSNRVGDYFNCRRGIATGANNFFCFSRADIREHHLTEAHVEPCITKAVDADGLVFTPDKFDSLAARERRCFLLNPSRNGQDLMHYLKLGEQQGIPQRHLPSHRPVWYLPENRESADIWVAVFSRASVKYILNTSDAKNLTCFHGLYAKPGCESLAPLMTLFLNSSGGSLSFSQVNRFYGDGLNKLEPKDVEEMPCPAMTKLSPKEAAELVGQLATLEKLAAPEQLAAIDELAVSYFDIKATEPFSMPPHRVQIRRPVEQRRHHAVQVQ